MVAASPEHLLGVLYGFSSGGAELLKARRVDAGARPAVEAAHKFLEGRESQLKGYEPVESRGGLVALRRPSPPGLSPPQPSDLVVCNPVTGQHVSLPRPSTWDESFVLLPDGGGDFRLHVVNLELADAGMLQLQTFTSSSVEPSKSAWGAVVATYAHLPLGAPSRFLRPSALVLDGVAYWLCKSESECLGYHVLALPLDGQRQPAPIKLADKVLQRPEHDKARGFDADDLLLTSTMVNGKRRLTLAVVKNITISLWTLEDDQVKPARWTRHKFFDMWKIMVDRGCPAPWREEGDKLALECFSEASGSLLLHFYLRMLYKLDLKTGEVETGEVELFGVYCKRGSSNMCEYEIS
ncbi:hypothetical protein CFC21_074026 [Triticum aestivum]|uniref:DUF7595 domain-containing protein n=3 Tax=Triticum TaxID=4564 RepID=A0A9R0XKG7_TRITD|nr:hypothetical protein CFC21_074026 [Triticum aestivum]VAI38100.1 unnamed protein product [Triticum turgidum subsp. durum]